MRVVVLIAFFMMCQCRSPFVEPFTLKKRYSHRPQAIVCLRANLDENSPGAGFFRGVKNFFDELDAFVDDATARRLGNGASFYGKRKSSFYGKNDKMKKKERNTADPLEDYQGPTSSGFFKWVPDEDGQLRPVSRMKEKNLERSPSFWDRAFRKDD